MKSLTRYYFNLIRLGTSTATDGLSYQERERIILTNNFALAVFVYYFAYTLFYYFQNLYIEATTLFLSFVSMFVFAFLQHKKKYTFANTIFILSTCFAISIPDYTTGFQTRAEAYFLPNILLCFLIFDFSKSRWLFLINLLPVLFFAVPRLIWGFEVAVQLNSKYLAFFRWSNYLGSMGITFYFALTYVFSLKRYQKTMMINHKFSSLGEMAAGLAHELNNPLAILNAKIDLLKIHFQGHHDKAHESLLQMEDTVDRMAHIIKSLKTFSRSQSYETTEDISLQKLIKQTQILVDERFKKLNISFTLQGDEALTVKGNSAALMQVFLNLLNNSIDSLQQLQSRAISSQSWINVSISETKNQNIKILVTDSGPALSLEIADKMMQPFFTTKEVGHGTGMGLSISLGIIEKHRGQFIYNQDSANCQFVITLPRA